MSIHIEGAGLLGSMMMLRLDATGRDFTWSDTRAEYTAWNASTGLVYPDANVNGFEYNSTCWSVFKGARSVPYVYAHKAPPHGSPFPASDDYGPLRRSSQDATVVDVGRFVEGARERFADREVSDRPAGSAYVQARPGFLNTSGYRWGWSRPVSFTLPDCLPADLPQPALYSKAHRFDMTYAYPYLPGVWLAGSSSIAQKAPKRRADAEDRYLQWVSNAERLLGVQDVRPEGPITEGWRPVGSKRFSSRAGDRWVLPALGGDGVRQGWSYVDALLELIDADVL